MTDTLSAAEVEADRAAGTPGWAPDRIWAWRERPNDIRCWDPIWSRDRMDGDVEYVRADLHLAAASTIAAQAARIAALEAALTFLDGEFGELVNRHYGGELPCDDAQIAGFAKVDAVSRGTP